MATRHATALIATLATLPGLALLPTGAGAALNDTSVVSVPSIGSFGANTGSSEPVAISADGRYVVFNSDADNLVTDDNDAVSNAYVRDRVTGTTELISLPSGTDGSGNDGGSEGSAITPDGRFVLFGSESANIAGNNNDTYTNMYVRDRLTRTTELVSLPTGTDGSGNDGHSGNGTISADGRYVAFGGQSGNLVANDNGAVGNAYLRDRRTKRTTLVSLPTGHDGSGNDDWSVWPYISADGRYVTYTSGANNLSPDDNDGVDNVYVRDLEAGTTEWVSKSSAGAPADGSTFAAGVSGDGRYVLFNADPGAPALVPNDNNATNTYRHDRLTGTTQLASLGDGWDGTALTGVSWGGSISADGRYVAFSGEADALATNDNDALTNVYVRDMLTGTTDLASLPTGTDGTAVDDHSSEGWISADGRFVAYTSQASNLVAGDSNLVADVFIRAVLPTSPENVAAPALTGEPVVGQALTCSDGVWTEGTPTRIWRRNEQPIGGATASTYTLVADDAGDVVDCVVTATNADGTGSATSNAVVPVMPLQGPTGPAGANGQAGAGTTGPQGPAGPAGPAGQQTTIVRVLVGLISNSVTAKSGAKVKFRYLTTGPATVTFEIRKGSKVLASVKQNATAAGRRTLSWNGKAGTKVLAAGSYTTRITITGEGGTDTDAGKLRVRRR